MSQELFAIILQSLSSLPLSWVALNHYNEPLLDPQFLDKASLLARYGRRLRLYTNGILLSPQYSRTLAELGIIESVVVNIPSPNPVEYNELMGIKMSDCLLPNICAAAEHGFKIHLCVNGLPENARKNKEKLKEILDSKSKRKWKAYANFTHDRAGVLKNQFVTSKGIWNGSMAGCQRILEHIHINIAGKVFLCCQDYYQKHILGDLLKESVPEILYGDVAVEYYGKIFGYTPSPPDFICRSCAELRRPKRVAGDG
jgi:hypothetical protein